MNKSNKIGFKIKLSSETADKLRHEVTEGTENDSQDTNESLIEDRPVSIDKECDSLPEVKENEIPEKISDHCESDVKSSPELIESSCDNKSPNNSGDCSSSPPSNSKESVFGEYSEHIRYEEDVAVYTDPSTNIEYIWCTTKNEWILRHSNITQDSSDENRSVTYENGVATYTDKDGTVFIWDSDKSAWFPKIDDDFMAQYQMSYGFVENSDEKDDEKNEDEVANNSKATTDKEAQGVKRKNQEPPKWFDISDEKNTSVYVSNLPLNITEEEFVDLMQKCGLVMRDPVTQKMKIKLYTKPNSKQLKGDALCTYIKVESVDLALNIIDGYTFKNHRIQVEKAHFQMKGEYNPDLKPKKKKRKDKEKIKKMQEKLFDWRPEKFRGERSKHEKVVIIKNLFEPCIFDKEVQLILEYQEDLRDECSKLGEVKKVALYDRHPEGVAQVIMKEPEEADNVVKLLNGRWFGKRQITAEIWDGKTKYKMEETDADLNKRLNTWENFLEQKEKT